MSAFRDAVHELFPFVAPEVADLPISVKHSSIVKVLEPAGPLRNDAWTEARPVDVLDGGIFEGRNPLCTPVRECNVMVPSAELEIGYVVDDPFLPTGIKSPMPDSPDVELVIICQGSDKAGALVDTYDGLPVQRRGNVRVSRWNVCI